MKQIYIYGSDKRQLFIGSILKEKGFRVINCDSCDFKPWEDPAAISHTHADVEIIILPIPVQKEFLNRLIPFIHEKTYIIGGNLPTYLQKICEEEHAKMFDYMKLPQIAYYNTIATAEGAICEAIMHSSCNLHDSNCLITGYGKCGSAIAARLKGLNAHTEIITKGAAELDKAYTDGFLSSDRNYKKYDFIFQTAPSPDVIDKNIIDKLSKECVIIDIASAPGGTNFSYCKQKGIFAKNCLGLPAKYAPKASAKIIVQEIMHKLNS